MVKKLVMIVLAMAMILLVGCGKTGEDTKNTLNTVSIFTQDDKKAVEELATMVKDSYEELETDGIVRIEEVKTDSSYKVIVTYLKEYQDKWTDGDGTEYTDTYEEGYVEESSLIKDQGNYTLTIKENNIVSFRIKADILSKITTYFNEANASFTDTDIDLVIDEYTTYLSADSEVQNVLTDIHENIAIGIFFDLTEDEIEKKIQVVIEKRGNYIYRQTRIDSKFVSMEAFDSLAKLLENK